MLMGPSAAGKLTRRGRVGVSSVFGVRVWGTVSGEMEAWNDKTMYIHYKCAQICQTGNTNLVVGDLVVEKVQIHLQYLGAAILLRYIQRN